jgi:xylulokinase
MYYIGIDSGTQSTKALVLDVESGEIVAVAQEAYGLIEGLPAGHMEQHPQLWMDAVGNTVASCMEQLGERRDRVRGIGVSGQQHGLVVLDEHEEVIRPAKLWCDTSTAGQCQQFASAFAGAAGLIELAGNPMLPGYTAPKILWLKQNEAEHFDRVRSVMLPHDYINFRLTGVKRMEYGDASGTGLMNVRTRQWCGELIDFIDPKVRDMLPTLGSSNERHGLLSPEWREAWGLGGEIVVSAGGGDNMMGAIGTGNVSPGVITASLGTSGTLYGCMDSPVIDAKGEIAAFCDSTDQWLPLVCVMNVTVVTEKVRNMFGWGLDELEAQIVDSEPGAQGLQFLPYLTGERTPNLPDGKGVIHGLTPENMTPGNIGRAAMEGATLGLAYGLRGFRKLGMNPGEIRMTGGGSKSPAWRQIAANVFGVPVVALATAEGAGLGAAIQAATLVAKESGSDEGYACLADRLVKLDEATRCQPDPRWVEFYEGKLDKQVALTVHLKQGGLL